MMLAKGSIQNKLADGIDGAHLQYWGLDWLFSYCLGEGAAQGYYDDTKSDGSGLAWMAHAGSQTGWGECCRTVLNRAWSMSDYTGFFRLYSHLFICSAFFSLLPRQYDGVSLGRKHSRCPVPQLARAQFFTLSDHGAFDQSDESHHRVGSAEAKESE